jgi:hypothetical protein
MPAMSWAGKQHPLEAVVEWLAPIPLALAVGWAGARLGLSPIEAIAAGLAALALGFAAIRLGGDTRAASLQCFEPADFSSVDLGELILEEKDAILELDDPLEEPNPDSRVVHLFARQDPTPGELVDRIAYFLGEGSREVPAETPTAEASRHPDASAALHDALANIRASLR